MLIYWKNTVYKQTKNKVVIIEMQVKNKHIHFTIKSSFFDEINYWMWGDFLKQFTHRGRSNTEQFITSICKQDTLNSQIDLTSQAPSGSLPSKYTSMRNIYWTYLAVCVVETARSNVYCNANFIEAISYRN